MAACRSHKHTRTHLIKRILQLRLLYLLLNNYYDCTAILPKLGTKVNLPEHDWGSFAVNEQCSTACFGPGCTALLRAPAQLQTETALKPFVALLYTLAIIEFGTEVTLHNWSVPPWRPNAQQFLQPIYVFLVWHKQWCTAGRAWMGFATMVACHIALTFFTSLCANNICDST